MTHDVPKILQSILAKTKETIRERQGLFPESELLTSPLYTGATRSLRNALTCTGSSSVIAEFKRQSPSNGRFSFKGELLDIVKGYTEAGAAALSILSDKPFFGGTPDDLSLVREWQGDTPERQLPILRKDFIIHPYQVLEAKASGADAILLIARILDDNELLELSSVAREYSLEILYEVHTLEELERVLPLEPEIVGFNCRDLDTLTVHPERFESFLKNCRQSIVAVCESAINSKELLQSLRNQGASGFLIGTHFLKSEYPALVCADFCQRD